MDQSVNSPTLIKMASLRNSMTKSEQQVVDTILEEPSIIIHSSVSDLAYKSNVSEPTVIRACRSLGMSGYHDLKITLTKELIKPIQLINEDITGEDTVADVVTKTINSVIRTLESTLQTVSMEDIARALDIIDKADRIAIIGFGNSHAIAEDLQHKLMRVGKAATAYGDPYLAAIAITSLKKDDILFCISHSGSSRNVVELAQQAKDNNISIISISNIGVTPLSKISTVTLHTSSAESNYRIIGLNSRFAQLSIIDSLHALLSMRNSQNAMLYPEDAVKKFNY